ncbi:MAG: NAD(P)-dependent alcohol dehydrogenase [Haliea sp.]
MYRRLIVKILAGLTATALLALGALALVINHNAPCGPVPPMAQGAAGFAAIMQHCYGDADILTLETVSTPELAENQVLVRVHAASVNPLDKHFLHGTPYLLRLVNGFNAPKSPGAGADFAGVVEAAGEGVTRFEPGDEVFGVAKGAFAEYVVRSETGSIALKPANLSFEQAAAMPVAAITALQALRDKARVEPGQQVLINGASGGVGTYAVQLAKAMGATVTAVCSGRNAELVRALGADQVIDYTRQDFTKDDNRYDAIIDMVGNHSLPALLDVTEPNGVLVMVGDMQINPWWGPLVQPLHAAIRSPFVSQRLESILARANADDLAVLANYAEAGQLTSAIDQRFTLEQVPDAIRYVERGRTRGKVVINVVP